MNGVVRTLVVGGIGAAIGCIVLGAIVLSINSQRPTLKQNIAPMAEQPTAAKQNVAPSAPNTGVVVSGVFMPSCKAYEFYNPRSGKQLVGIRVTIKNNTNKQISVNPLYFYLVGRDGVVVAPELGSCEDQIDTTKIGPGQAMRGVVGFAVDAGTVATSIQYTGLFDAQVIGPVTLQ